MIYLTPDPRPLLPWRASSEGRAVAETMQQLVREHAGDGGPAVLAGERSWTWREHVAAASAHAAAVTALLREPAATSSRPPHVGALLGNSPAMLEAMAAAALGGYVLMGLNTTRQGPALLADVRRADCRLLLVDAEHRALLDGLGLDGLDGLSELGVRVVDVDGWEPGGELTPLKEVEPLRHGVLDLTRAPRASGDPATELADWTEKLRGFRPDPAPRSRNSPAGR